MSSSSYVNNTTGQPFVVSVSGQGQTNGKVKTFTLRYYGNYWMSEDKTPWLTIEDYVRYLSERYDKFVVLAYRS